MTSSRYLPPVYRTCLHCTRDLGLRLAGLPAGDRLAIEMWLSEEDEARALSGELALLERQWKEAEELAAIADGLSLAPVVEP